LTFTTNSAGCITPPGYSMNKNGQVTVGNLPSGVTMLLSCLYATGVNRRWDVTTLTDPWYTTAPHPNEEQFQGFCSAGYIAEAAANPNTETCVIMDRQVAQCQGCSPSTPINTCKQTFCQQNYKSMTWGNGAPTVADCMTFVTSTSSLNNYLVAACTLTYLAPYGNPNMCNLNDACSQCVSDSTDYPDEMCGILANTPPPLQTPAPTISCPNNLLTVGLNRKTLSSLLDGIQIDQLIQGTWTGVFALLDTEIAACGGCSNTLFVNGSVSTNAALFQVGALYRVKQCTGLNTDPTQDLCQGASGYNATVTYASAFDGVQISAAYGGLFADDKLVCSPTVYKYCPLDYNCCIWSKSTQNGAWNNCMTKFGGGNKYPNCGTGT